MTHTPRFKQTYIDFVVEEHLPYSLTKKGTRFYVQLEKKNTNTMDLLKRIMKEFGFSRKHIGIAGLKDKHALAKQRFCFHGNDIKKIGEKSFLYDLGKISSVITTGYSHVPLWLGSMITNQFRIRLKYDQPLPQEKKSQLEARFATLMSQWFGNTFGEQRFGVSRQNHRIAQDILKGGKAHLSLSEKMFKLQAYASWLFNNYLSYRLKQHGKISLLEGDIVVDPGQQSYLLALPQGNFSSIAQRKDKGFFVTATPRQVPIENNKLKEVSITWALIGYNILLSPPLSVAGKLEQERLIHFELTPEHLHLFKTHKIFGLRRPLRVVPKSSTLTRQGNDLLLSFILPKSAYASVVVDSLLQETD